MWAEVQWGGLFMSRSYTFSNNRSFFAFKSSSSDRVIVSRSRTDDDERPLVSLLSLPRCCRVLALWSWFSISLFVISCCMVASESCCSKVWLENVSPAAKNVYANNPGPSISSSSSIPTRLLKLSYRHAGLGWRRQVISGTQYTVPYGKHRKARVGSALSCRC